MILISYSVVRKTSLRKSWIYILDVSEERNNPTRVMAANVGHEMLLFVNSRYIYSETLLWKIV